MKPMRAPIRQPLQPLIAHTSHLPSTKYGIATNPSAALNQRYLSSKTSEHSQNKLAKKYLSASLKGLKSYRK